MINIDRRKHPLRYCAAITFLTLCILVCCMSIAAMMSNGQSSKYAYLLQVKTGIISNTPKDYTGTWRTWYRNGQIRSEAEYLNGKYHGKRIVWHFNGVKHAEHTYVMESRHGLWSEWGESGEPIVSGIYKDNLPHDGTFHFEVPPKYFSAGCRAVASYAGGVLSGENKVMDKSGEVVFSRTWKNDKPWDGLFVGWEQDAGDVTWQFDGGKRIATISDGESGIHAHPEGTSSSLKAIFFRGE